MKAVVVITDWEVMEELERELIASGSRGFTIIPKVVGTGRTGLKSGDRIHPGGSSLLFAVLPEGEVEPTVAVVRSVRDRRQASEATRIYLANAEEVA